MNGLVIALAPFLTIVSNFLAVDLTDFAALKARERMDEVRDDVTDPARDMAKASREGKQETTVL